MAGPKSCFLFPATSISRVTMKSRSARRFSTLLETLAGMRGGRQLKGCIPGGSSSPVIPGNMMMDCPMDYDSIAKAGSMLGSGALIIMDETTCMVKSASACPFSTHTKKSRAGNARRVVKERIGSAASFIASGTGRGVRMIWICLPV